MKSNILKRTAAVLLMLGMMLSAMVVSFAADGFDLTDLVPNGSNPPTTEETTTAAPENTNALGAVGQLVGNWFVPTAPDQVKEAFGDADEEYAKTHDYCFAVNTSQNIVIAYQMGEDGTFSKPVKAFVCSCGLPSTPTKKGVFRTSDRYMWRALNGGVYGQYATRITGHYLFHSVPYKKQDPSTLKTAEYNKLGQNASEGCVRLAAHDAKWIKNRCPEGTIVYIYSGENIREPLAKPTAQHIDPKSPNAGWDPTDPKPENPWKK